MEPEPAPTEKAEQPEDLAEPLVETRGEIPLVPSWPGPRSRLDEDGKPLPPEQLVFFVRHAESRWNAAQASLSAVGMLCENDHGLSEEGKLQAEALREKVQAAKEKLLKAGTPQAAAPEDWERLLLDPDVVYSSPFTRALQTACIGLKELFPGSCRLAVMREAREHKRLGGADSTGIACGEAIRDRVRDEIRYLYENEDADSDSKTKASVKDFDEIQLDTSSVVEEWWGPLMGESQEDMEDNIQNLMDRLRRTKGRLATGGGAAVLVGHSLMIRSIFQYFMKPGACAHSATLRTKVIPCCGVVGVRIVWDEMGRPCIEDAMPMLGTVLAEPDFDEGKPRPPRGEGCMCGRGKAEQCVIS